LWDTNELYDLQTDPDETTNLIFEPEHQETVAKLNKRLFELLAKSGGMNLRLAPDRGPTFPKRHPERSGPADFPKQFYGTSE
jgi:N-acetylglucosamine-6-sulfatase